MTEPSKMDVTEVRSRCYDLAMLMRKEGKTSFTPEELDEKFRLHYGYGIPATSFGYADVRALLEASCWFTRFAHDLNRFVCIMRAYHRFAYHLPRNPNIEVETVDLDTEESFEEKEEESPSNSTLAVASSAPDPEDPQKCTMTTEKKEFEPVNPGPGGLGEHVEPKQMIGPPRHCSPAPSQMTSSSSSTSYWLSSPPKSEDPPVPKNLVDDVMSGLRPILGLPPEHSILKAPPERLILEPPPTLPILEPPLMEFMPSPDEKAFADRIVAVLDIFGGYARFDQMNFMFMKIWNESFGEVCMKFLPTDRPVQHLQLLTGGRVRVPILPSGAIIFHRGIPLDLLTEPLTPCASPWRSARDLDTNGSPQAAEKAGIQLNSPSSSATVPGMHPRNKLIFQNPMAARKPLLSPPPENFNPSPLALSFVDRLISLLSSAGGCARFHEIQRMFQEKWEESFAELCLKLLPVDCALQHLNRMTGGRVEVKIEPPNVFVFRLRDPPRVKNEESAPNSTLPKASSAPDPGDPKKFQVTSESEPMISGPSGLSEHVERRAPPGPRNLRELLQKARFHPAITVTLDEDSGSQKEVPVAVVNTEIHLIDEWKEDEEKRMDEEKAPPSPRISREPLLKPRNSPTITVILDEDSGSRSCLPMRCRRSRSRSPHRIVSDEGEDHSLTVTVQNPLSGGKETLPKPRLLPEPLPKSRLSRAVTVTPGEDLRIRVRVPTSSRKSRSRSPHRSRFEEEMTNRSKKESVVVSNQDIELIDEWKEVEEKRKEAGKELLKPQALLRRSRGRENFLIRVTEEIPRSEAGNEVRKAHSKRDSDAVLYPEIQLLDEWMEEENVIQVPTGRSSEYVEDVAMCCDFELLDEWNFE